MAVRDRFLPVPKRGFEGATDAQWNDWRWQQRERLRTVHTFEKTVQLTQAERDAFTACAERFEVAVTPY